MTGAGEVPRDALVEALQARDAVEKAILAAVHPAVRHPSWPTVHRAVWSALGGARGAFRGGDIDDRIREMLISGTRIYAAGGLIKRVRLVPPERAACRQRTDDGQMAGAAAQARRSGGCG